MMEDIFVVFGVDPGTQGGITVCLDGKPQNMVAYNLEDLSSTLEILQEYKEFRRIIVLEEPPPFAGKNIPSSAGYKLGVSVGQIEGLARGLFIRCEKISPKTWQQGLTGLSGKSGSARKKVLKNHASRLYPHLKPTLKTADAILLTHFFITNPKLGGTNG